MSQRKKNTFADLGIPFPLFDGPAENASEYAGIGSCTLCQRNGQHCFNLGIGADVIVACAKCGTPNALDADDGVGGSCSKCLAPVAFPASRDEEVLVCYNCLRAGKAALTKDTTLGMIRWEDAIRGFTHGLPGKIETEFELGPVSEEGWTSIKLPPELMMELVRTPTYSTIQGDQWQFCCKEPMTFTGTWGREDFSIHAKDGDGKKFFNEVVQDIVPGLWEDELHDETGIYVFRCGLCNRITAHWDLA